MDRKQTLDKTISRATAFAMTFALAFVLTEFGTASVAHSSIGANVQETTTESDADAPDAMTTENTETESNESDQTSNVSVGYPGRIEIPIAGSELKAKPISDRTQKMIVRVLETYVHGDRLRYDLEYVGLEPGEHNLIDYLERVDGSEIGDVDPVNVTISATLPPGQIEPNEMVSLKTKFQSYYLPALLVLGALWLLGFFAILFGGRAKMFRPSGRGKKETVADRMRPLITKAIRGKLDMSQKAELERVMVGFWKKKLKLGHLKADELRERLRSNSESSVMLEQLDNWLHRPDGDGDIDVTAFLKPYQTMNYDEL